MSATDRNSSSASGLKLVPEISPKRSMSCFLQHDSTSICQKSGMEIHSLPLHEVASGNNLHLTAACMWWPQQRKRLRQGPPDKV